RDLGVRNELLVVFERVVSARPSWCRTDSADARRHTSVDRFDRERRRDVLVGIWSRIGILGIRMGNELPREDCRVRRHEMTEPRNPGAIVCNSAKGRDQLRARLEVAASHLGFSLVDHGLVEAGTAATRLVDDVARDTSADEVRIPALAAIRRRFEACGGWPRGLVSDRKSTRLNSSHVSISYAVFCL